ncbi:acyl-CoA dehydrogenase [Sphingorhabdus pulchriflava]|jgi:alkylation response protein AidB-like acyl-CoA dehydrogenase|uniref:Acyl-CoA dehydrogenase n=1 Tax=Sphingorhabdus pulchriflava TaxID=2292257 RepID=A0A371B5X5_9SPHN|nr:MULTISPECIES: acyl-CoA dehydrogenase family protein [Sphingorhabdus]RDV02995.1 acyl-CoA dehydrogenase [Sphingorhabdus pulchriflava]HMS19086.1 acyl-CoA dehydrogenase family protein [Sphingorhabdus sp.]HMT40948.1 acyl-CoA dehydrogenase family protein [Sphingorhabdus sp.]HMU21683.1 acyl-CoA dehydrogenase family protein [Sphingorhabdus sp.]
MSELEAFRTEIRAWIEANCPPEMKTPIKSDDDTCWGGRNFVFQSEAQKQWMERCAAAGLTVPDWPKDYGGAGLSPAETKIFRQEMARAGARSPLNSFGIWMLGPALLKFGTEEQKRHYLPQIARGEIRWCQGYSEPGSGSDLVSLQTFGEDKGDHWVVNGQKIWTSYADKADWIFCLVRTDKENKYQGISFLLFDMTTPGVTTKPIKLISGNSPFCETFFDNVVVPKHQIVGELNRGWDVAKYLLGHEREMISGMGGDGGTASLGGGFKDALGDEPILRAQLAMFDVESLAFRAHSERFMDEWKTGTAHPAYSNLMKYIGTELNKKRHELVMAAGGSDYLEWESERSNGGKRARDWLRTKANSIEGGTSEVMLNVVAKRILDMPGA